MPDDRQHTEHDQKVINDSNDIDAKLDNDIAPEVAEDMHTPAYTSSDPVAEMRLYELLGERVPPDWCDPETILLRTNNLARVACAAAESMIEMLVRLRDERAKGVHMNPDGCVYTATTAIHDLHRALIAYRRDTLRLDGEAIVQKAMVNAHGAGIAGLTLRSLAELRGLITNEMRAVSSQAQSC
jgi:hypothetical protein